jgi:hypothetical protein
VSSNIGYPADHRTASFDDMITTRPNPAGCLLMIDL